MFSYWFIIEYFSVQPYNKTCAIGKQSNVGSFSDQESFCSTWNLNFQGSVAVKWFHIAAKPNPS